MNALLGGYVNNKIDTLIILHNFRFIEIANVTTTGNLDDFRQALDS